MLDKIWDVFVDTCTTIFFPLVCSYFAITGNLFLNVSYEGATGLEKFANQALSPVHYLFVGKTASKKENGEWDFSPRFQYRDHFAIKTVLSTVAFAPSLIVGAAAKGAAFFDSTARQHHREMSDAIQNANPKPLIAYYRSVGIEVGGNEPMEWLQSQMHERRPGDENYFAIEKQALREIGELFDQYEIPWWVDCGTCLGAYRHGGAIPYDGDIDIAVLLPDFKNVLKALRRLDPEKYEVQDWSTRDYPESFIKVYVKKTGKLIDIYHFDIHPEKRQIEYVFSLEKTFFFPEWFKIRERRYKEPAPYDMVFPLKKAQFDGVAVHVPNETVKYLQRYYGENLNPARIFDPTTGQYEKDLTHPYWQRSYVH